MSHLILLILNKHVLISLVYLFFYQAESTFLQICKGCIKRCLYDHHAIITQDTMFSEKLQHLTFQAVIIWWIHENVIKLLSSIQ